MIHGTVRVPTPSNGPVKSYAPPSPERQELKEALRQATSDRVDIPLVIGGKAVPKGNP